jgi:hypothetical protein
VETVPAQYGGAGSSVQRIVHDKIHVMEHVNDALDAAGRAEFFRKRREMRDVVKGRK